MNAEYIFPEPQNTIIIAEEDTPAGDMPLGIRIDSTHPLHDRIIEELSAPFHQSMIKMNQCARNIGGNTEGPNVLFMSTQDGGFARTGLNLQDKQGRAAYKELHYIDLVLSEERLNDGALHTFAHELAHVMMKNILGELPEGRSNKQHVSMGVTDYFTAFVEGWAIQFERQCLDAMRIYQDIFAENDHYRRNIVKHWHCEADGNLRLTGVLDNLYIHKKHLPARDISRLSLAERIILEHTSTHFDTTRVKTGEQMLACEGVVATLFYRICTSDLLRNRYLKKSQAQQFLLEALPEGQDCKDFFTPFENVLLKSFWVWHKLADGILETGCPTIAFFKEWCRQFPGDREEMVMIFLETTVGKTVTQEIAHHYENLAYYGMIGNVAELRRSIDAYREAIESAKNEILSGTLALDENLKLEVWKASQTVKMPACLWVDDAYHPLMVNVNTASVYELMALGMDEKRAAETVRERDGV